MLHRRRRTAVAALLAAAALTAGASSARAAPAWLAQPDLTAPGENASVPGVAVNGAGDAVVAWQRASGPGYVAQASVRPAGGSLSPPIEFDTAGFEVLGPPQVAIDAAGDAVLIWQRFTGVGTNTIVQASFRPAGGSFGAPVPVSDPSTVAVHPQIAMNDAGDVVVAWEHHAGATMMVQATVRAAGGAFTAPVDLSAASGQGPLPRVAIDAAGNATVVWTQTSAAGVSVQAATRPAGATFTAPVDLSAVGPTGGLPTPGQVAAAQVATNAGGDTVAAWTRLDAANDAIVQTATRPAGGAFSTPADVSVAGRSADDPHVAIDAAGNAFAVWTRFDGTSRVVQFAARPAGGSFGAPVDLSLAGGEAREPQIAVGPGGQAVVVWQRSDGANTIVQATVRGAGIGVTPARDLSLAGRDATAPQVGVDADGDALAAWQRSDGTNTIAQAAAYDAAGPQLRGLSVPSAVTAGSAATFSLTPLDVWSPVTSTQWAFDDGTSATGADVSHAFAAPGERTVTVTAADALGNATSATRSVTVAGPPAQEPGATATPPPPPPCASCGARPARLGSRIAYDARVTRRYTVITKLLIQPAYTGTTVRLRCSGRGCRFTSKTRTVARQTRRLDLTTLVRSAKLRPGAELQIRVTRADRIGTMATLGIRARNRPRRITRCLFPGDPMPAACPP